MTTLSNKNNSQTKSQSNSKESKNKKCFFNFSNTNSIENNNSSLNSNQNPIIKENIFDETNCRSYLSLVQKIPNTRCSERNVCRTSIDSSLSEVIHYERQLSHSICDIKFDYFDHDDNNKEEKKSYSKSEHASEKKDTISDHNSSSSSNKNVPEMKNENDFLIKDLETGIYRTAMHINSPTSKDLTTNLTLSKSPIADPHSPSKSIHRDSIFLSPKHKTIKANRGSIVSFKGTKISTKRASYKRSSMIYLVDKNANMNELSLVGEMDKIYHYKTREMLLNNIPDPTTQNNKHTRKVNNLRVENVKGKLIAEKYVIITPMGIENRKRKATDCISFFGYNEIDNVNDYVLNNENYIFNTKTFTKTLFAFSYDIQYNKYFIQPILDKDKQGRFISQKILTPYRFISPKIVFIHKNIIEIIPESNDISSLHIKVYEKDNERYMKYDFHNCSNGQLISIGTDEKCSIHLLAEGNTISTIHTVLMYDKERDIWEIMDGIEGKPSISGTWVALDNKIGIEDEVILKLGDDILKVMLI